MKRFCHVTSLETISVCRLLRFIFVVFWIVRLSGKNCAILIIMCVKKSHYFVCVMYLIIFCVKILIKLTYVFPFTPNPSCD